VDGTVAHLAIDGQYGGHLIIADQVKPDAQQAIRALHAQGIQTAMLTGDSQAVADRIAQQLGLDQYRAELLPEDKVEALEGFLHQAQADKGRVAFVGDGINDAPVIARADVGLAMGGLGSDAAIETADVVLMTDHPSQVVAAIAIAHKTRRIVWQNIIFAMAIKGIFIALGAVGLATLWEAVFADIGVALLAILNASRIIRSPQ
jgi:Cd2+/Zn2+-exporting ATPase